MTVNKTCRYKNLKYNLEFGLFFERITFPFEIIDKSSRMFCVFLFYFSFPFCSYTQSIDFVNQSNNIPGLFSGTVVWGDYDRDNDLDILAVGKISDTTFVSRVYRNDNGTFTNIDAGLQGIHSGTVVFGDLDNDSDLDIIISGARSTSRITKVYLNEEGLFNEINAGIIGTVFGSISLGDYDNDKDLDILLTGLTVGGHMTEIYRNDNGAFTNVNAGLQNVSQGDAQWGDYDRDGDLDIVLAGDSSIGNVTKIYDNEGGAFTNINADLTGVSECSVNWGDYDGDKDLDLIVSGEADSGNYITKIYKNDDGTFVDSNIELPGVSNGNASWADADLDGDLDLLLVGTKSDGSLYTGVFLKTKDGFIEIDKGSDLQGVTNGNGDWGDYNHDKYQDILLAGLNDSGTPSLFIYRNTGLGLSEAVPGSFADETVRQAIINEIRQKEDTSRQAALSYAAANNITIKEVDNDNKTYELVGMSEDDGSPIFNLTDNANAAISTAVIQIRDVAPYNLNGSGHSVGVWDAGSVLSTHQAFQKSGFGSRIKVLDGAASHYHATHVGGTIGGNSLVLSALGMAPDVIIDSYDWSYDESEMVSRAAGINNDSSKLYISNHSYGYITGWYTPNGSTWYWQGVHGDREDRSFGQYNFQAEDWDQIVYSAPYYLPFKSAGNDRNDNPNLSNGASYIGYNASWQRVSLVYNTSTGPLGDGYDNGGFDSIGGSGISKNVMTVGAVVDAVSGGSRNPASAGMTSFSGWGPADDGRIKPDIVANGYNLYSAHNYSNSYYAGMSGTSMSSPNAAGSAVLLQEYYHDLNGTYMLASTLKALIIHTADDLGNPGPDYKNGWGLMNVKAVVDVIKTDKDLPNDVPVILAETCSNGETKTYSFRWDAINPIRISLCWTDPAHNSITGGVDNPIPVLVNDLDMRVSAPDSTQYKPYILNLAAKNNPATTGDNVVDNVEQVFIANPDQQGDYTIAINHKGTLGSPQTFSLIITGQAESTGPKVVHPIADQITTDDQPYSYTIPGNTFEDDDMASVSYAALLNDDSQLPDWLSFDPEARILSGVPAISDAGVYSIKIIATNGDAENGSDTFKLTVNHVNRLPTISDIANSSVFENFATDPIVFTVGDVETAAGDVVTTGISSNNSLVANQNIVFAGSGSERSVTITPSADKFGIALITITVNDGTDQVSDVFALTVLEYQTPTNNASLGSSTDISGSVTVNLAGEFHQSWQVEYNGSTVDLNGDLTSYALLDIRGDVTTVKVRALGHDSFGVFQQDEEILNFVYNTAAVNNLNQNPNSDPDGVPYKSSVILSLNAVGATAVAVAGRPMIPASDPNVNQTVTWTLTHEAIDGESLNIYATTPGNPGMTQKAGSFDIVLEAGIAPVNSAHLQAAPAVFGQPLQIILDGEHQLEWTIVHDDSIIELPGDTTDYTIDNVHGDLTHVIVQAIGVNEQGKLTVDEANLNVVFAATQAITLTQSPNSDPDRVARNTNILLTVETTGAVTVTVNGIDMIPVNPPLTTNENTWTLAHDAVANESLTVKMVTPGDPQITATAGKFNIFVFGPPPDQVERSFIEYQSGDAVSIGGSVFIHLDADFYDAFEVVYNGETLPVDGGLNDNSILFDQTLTDGIDEVNAQNFDGIAFEVFDAVVADDFVIPENESWIIREVFLEGTEATAELTAADIKIYAADNGDLPGTLLVDLPEQNAVDDGQRNLTVTLSESITLSSGTYWLAYAGKLNFYEGGQWSVVSSTTKNSNEFVWKNEGEGWKYENTGSWVQGSTIIQLQSANADSSTEYDTDLSFSIRGNSIFTLDNIVANAPTVIVRALGLDFDGSDATDEIEIDLQFVPAIANNLTQEPNSQPDGIAFAADLKLTLDTVGASAVTVGGLAMTPLNDPNTSNLNFWSLTHAAVATETLSVEIRTPGNPVVDSHAGDFDILLFGPAPDNVERSFIDGPVQIGGAALIHLDADHQQSWQVIYNGQVYDISNPEPHEFWLPVFADAPLVTILAMGVDKFGMPAVDEIEKPLNFAAASCLNLVPAAVQSGLTFGDSITLSLDTVGARSVTVNGIAMIPANDPNIVNENLWSLIHSAVANVQLDVELTTPGNQAVVTHCGSFALELHGPTISGIAVIGGSVTINFNGGDQNSWEVIYDGNPTTLSGTSGQFVLNNLIGDQPTVTLIAHFTDKDPEVTVLSLPYEPATAVLTQTPNSVPDGVSENSVVTLNVQTTNAILVTVAGVSMVPGSDPNTTYDNSWTLDHNAIEHTVLPVVVTTPGNPLITNSGGDFEIIIADKLPQSVVHNGMILGTGGCCELITPQLLNVVEKSELPTDIIYTLISVPTLGDLFNMDSILEMGDTFTQDDINKRRITFEHNGGAIGDDGFNFSVGFRGEPASIEASFLIRIVETHLTKFIERIGELNPMTDKDAGTATQAAFVDIDADGDQDALVGAGSTGNLSYFENIGTKFVASYVKRENELNPFNGFSQDDLSKPTFIDLDADGDLDCFTVATTGDVVYYINTGTALEPLFIKSVDNSNPFRNLKKDLKLSIWALADVDIDDDRDLDAFIGEKNGTIAYVENTGSTSAGVFAIPDDNPLDSIDVGQKSRAVFVDLDCDGDFDCFISDQNGGILYYENVGTAVTPSFVERLGSENPLSHDRLGASVGSFGTPYFVDIDWDGDPDSFMADSNKDIRFFENLPGNAAPTNMTLTNTRIQENEPVNTEIGVFTAFDINGGDTHVFTLVAGEGDADNERFSIDGFVLNSAFVFDFETQNILSIRIRATDVENEFIEKTFIITVTNENEAPELVNPMPSFTIADDVENGTVVGDVTAADEDGDDLSFSITGGNADNVFEIDAVLGELTMVDNSMLSFIHASRYFLMIEVSDGELTDSAISIIDISSSNMHLPKIGAQTFAVSEDAGSGTQIGMIAATDNDGDQLSFVIAEGNTLGIFGVDAISGELTIKNDSNLDYEIAVSHILTIVVDDGRYEASALVTVNVINENSSPPQIEPQNFSVDENAINESIVGSVSATDADSEVLSFSIVTGNIDSIFSIGSSIGIIIVQDNSLLDYGITASYSLVIQVTDGRHTSAATITIDVLSNNINPPVIQPQTFTVSETASNRVQIGAVIATDPDGSSLSYEILSGNIDGAFSIDSSTGLITVADSSQLDYGTITTYTLDLQVSDSRYVDSADITIQVTSTNVNSPVITLDSAELTVSEDADNDFLIGTISASDPDGNELTYSIISGNTAAVFKIGDTNGEISVADNTQLDYETIPVYQLMIEVSDWRYSATAEVTVTVLNVNDNTPGFVDLNYVWIISESAAIGSFVGTIEAIDLDDDELLYSVTDGVNRNHFTLDSSSGEMTVSNTAALSFSDFPQYVFDIEVSDTIHVAQGTVTINLSTAPFVDDFEFDVFENAANNTVIGAVIANDNDEDTLLYTIVNGNSDAIFAIGDGTGALTVSDNTLLDFESEAIHELTVQVSDGSGTATSIVTINVIDVNDTAPGVGGDIEYEIEEHSDNGTIVGTLNVTDAENDSLTFTVVGGSGQGTFAIDETKAVITVSDNTLLDYEIAQSFELWIHVSDGIHTVLVSPTINVIDINDHAPELDDYEFDILESVANGVFVGSILAIDEDEDELIYTIISGDGSSVFTFIDTNQIYINDNTTIDYSITPQYNLIVEVSDGDHADTGNVVVNVIAPLAGNPGVPGSLPSPIICEDSEFTFVIDHFFNAGSNVSITAPTLPLWLSLIEDEFLSTLYGIPFNDDVGDHEIILSFDDGRESIEITFTIEVINVNDTPFQVFNKPIRVTEGATGTISEDVLKVDDVDNDPDVLTYSLISIPQDGLLKLNDTPLLFNDMFTQTDINSGNLAYVHSGVHHGGMVASDSFVFTVNDPDEDCHSSCECPDETDDDIGETVFNITIEPPFIVSSGPYNKPAFPDIDADGDLELFLGVEDGNVRFYENKVINQAHSFIAVDGVNNPLDLVDVEFYSAPAFADIDNDGDLDAFVGGYNGEIRYYNNIGSASDPEFEERIGNQDPLSSADVGFFSTPTFIDIDDDDDLDCFVGNYDGKLKYFENSGDNSNPLFIERAGEQNPLNFVDVGAHSSPAFVDMDNDGDQDCFSGEADGTVKFFRNVGDAASPVFVEHIGSDNPFNGVDAGEFSSPVFSDLNGDSIPDFFIGANGGISTVENSPANSSPIDIALSITTVVKEAALGAVVGEISAIDSDSFDAHSFSLVNGDGDEDNGHFRVDGFYLRTTVFLDQFDTSSFRIRLRVTDGVSAPFEKPLAISINSTISMVISSGWNIISMPFDLDDKSVVSVLKEVQTGPVWAYDTDAGSYYQATELYPKKGYWIYCQSGVPAAINITGTISESIDIPISIGWNLIGPVTNGLINTLYDESKIESMWEWSSHRQSFMSLESDDSLGMGKGYWILAE